MDSNTSYQTGGSGLPAPQSNNPFLQSSQGSVTAPTTGHTLADATATGFKDTPSSSTGFSAPSAASGYGSSSLGSTSASAGFGSSSLGNTSGSAGYGSTSGSTGLGSSSLGSTSSSTIDNSAAKDLGSNAAALGNSVMANLQSAATSIANHPTVQSINNGPVAQNVRDEAQATQSEFQNLLASRTRPEQRAATGQRLTYYHSTFYTLLTWQNPRATAIIFASSVALIFMTRYLNILSYFFKFAYFTLGITASLEIAGKLLFDNGLASRMRPRKYYTVSKESLATSLDDIEQLLNFFIIEGQRVLFAENIYATVAVFAAAVISFLFIKVVPFWGLALMGTCVLYLGPLIYIKNRETIDSTVDQMEHVISAQASQLRDLTVMHANQASQTVKHYADEYSHVAQDYIGSAKKSVSNAVDNTAASVNNAAASANNTAKNAAASVNNSANNAAASVNNTAASMKSEINDKTRPVGTTDSYPVVGTSYSAPSGYSSSSMPSSNSAYGATSSGGPTFSGSTYNSNPAFSTTSGSSVPISDFRTAAPPSNATLGSNEFRPLSSNDFPSVPKRESELVADSIRPRDSEVQSLLNH